jgi:glycosyltransferase involved in cell wall biosynthesis
VTLTAVVPDDPTPSAARILGSLSAVTVVRHGEAARRMGARADVVHRPCRINSPGDLSLLASLGDRLVITQEDLIGFHNPSYFEDADGWLGHRTLTRLSLALADHVVCVSGHARADALTEQLVEPSRASVVHNGVDHGLAGGLAPPSRPSRAAALPDQAEALLCLGTDYRHKNRLFALRILEQLQARHGWSGYLVFAGPHVALGSSRLDEVRWLTAHPASANRVIDCLAVSEGEKAWLFERSKLVLYPTTFEGFGLVPFEAAQRGVPCAWAPGTSLSEVLPDAAATLLPWDAAECADRVFALIRDRHVRERHLEAVRTAGAGLTWDAAAGRLIDLYNAVCDAPPPPLSALERSDGLMSGAVSQDAMQLFGPGGALPRDLERPLLALASHPRLAKPVLGAMKLGYRTTFKLRRLRQSQRPT